MLRCNGTLRRCGRESMRAPRAVGQGATPLTSAAGASHQQSVRSVRSR